MLPLSVPRKTKQPWNAGKDLYAPAPTQKPIETVTVGHSTAAHYDRYWIIRVDPDTGERATVTVAGKPWEGSLAKATTEAELLARQDARFRFEVVNAGEE